MGAIWAGLFALQFGLRPFLLGIGAGDIDEVANLPLLLFISRDRVSDTHAAGERRFAPVRSSGGRIRGRSSGKPDAYAAALYRLARQNLAELWPPRWTELLLSSHPAIGRRMARVSATRERGIPAWMKKPGQRFPSGTFRALTWVPPWASIRPWEGCMSAQSRRLALVVNGFIPLLVAIGVVFTLVRHRRQGSAGL